MRGSHARVAEGKSAMNLETILEIAVIGFVVGAHAGAWAERRKIRKASNAMEQK